MAYILAIWLSSEMSLKGAADNTTPNSVTNAEVRHSTTI